MGKISYHIHASLSIRLFDNILFLYCYILPQMEVHYEFS